jgi:hypothetical protein
MRTYSSTNSSQLGKLTLTGSSSSALVDIPLSRSASQNTDAGHSVVDVVGLSDASTLVGQGSRDSSLGRSRSLDGLAHHRTSNLNDIMAPLVIASADHAAPRRAQDAAARTRFEHKLKADYLTFKLEHPDIDSSALAEVEQAFSRLNSLLLHAVLKVGMHAQSGDISAEVVDVKPTSLRLTQTRGVDLRTITKTASSDAQEYTPEGILKLSITQEIHAPGGLYVPSTDKDGLSGYAVVPESATGISFGGSTLHLSAFDPVVKPAPQRRPNRDISTSP